MPMTKAEKQKAYRDRKKQQEGESYLEKERQRTKAYYVPIAERSKTDQEKRRKKVRKLVQKHRERNRQSTIEPSTSQPSQQVESTSQEQEQVVSSSTDNPISTPLVVRLPCQNPKNRTRKRISRQVAKCNREIERLKGENINTQRKYKTVSKRYERLVKRTTQNKSSENVGQDKETGNDTHGNDGPSSSKSGTEKLTPRKRTYKELRDEGLSPSKIPKIVKNKLVLANLLTDEIEDVYNKSDQQAKAIVTSIVSSSKLKEYKLTKTLSQSTGIRRSRLVKKRKKDWAKVRKRTRNRIKRESLRKDILTFLERDDNSREMPGKNDKTKTEDGHVQKRILNDNMAFLHLKYKTETSSNVSFSRFCTMRPKNIGLTRYLSRNKCLCQKHQNMALALKSMKKAGASVPLNPDEFIRKLRTTPANTFLSSLVDEEVVFSQWKKVDMPDGRKKTVIVDQTLKKEDFNSIMNKQICEFSQHVQRVKAQYAAISTLKENLPPGHILVQMDFAENFACSSADEVQSAYWNGTAVTLHPVVVYFKENSDTLKHKNFVYVSDDLGHNFGAVYAFIKDIVNEMKAAVNDIKMVHYWTDSPSSQYRNKSAFYVVSDHKNLLGIQAIWNYFETGHGKGPCDGIGGTSKRTADLAIRQGKIVVQNASDYFEKVGPLHKSASYRFVSSKDIDICRKEVEEINKSLIALKGTMQVHQVASVSKGRVKTCTTSCYCEYCIVGTLHDYSEGVIVKSRRNVEQNVETNLTVTQGDEHDEPETTTPGDNRYKQDDAVTSEDASKDIVEGDWVAVTYDDEWHIGKVITIDSDDELEIKFLRPTRTINDSKSLFKWPLPPDILNMKRTDILCQIIEPSAVGRSGRSFQIDVGDKEKILKKMK
ncbi:Hypothetical predicted protein [Mytilus galloprovincialis]|uniref:Uncharacterized protein n=1 Tax=Mytilus galloprovincialis TaxID=29158 RepID=A0A8B6DNV6_MYTGA|nr:Hypothetical predicted protein [Mytilus galloprovincialis]